MLFRVSVRGQGIIPIDRSQRDDRVLRAHIERCLHAGGSLVLFPEGRFGYGEHQPSSFHKGFAHFAKEAGVPVIPVALSGTRDLWVRRHVRVHIGDPLSPHDHSIDSLTAAAESRVRALPPPGLTGSRSATTAPPADEPLPLASRPLKPACCGRPGAGNAATLTGDG